MGSGCVPVWLRIIRRSSRSARRSRRPHDGRFRFFGNIEVGATPKRPRWPSATTRWSMRWARNPTGHSAILASSCQERCGGRLRRLVQRTSAFRGDGTRPVIRTGRRGGNGNVAIDVARILVTDPDVLAATDRRPRADVPARARCRGSCDHRPPRSPAIRVHDVGTSGAWRTGRCRRHHRSGRPRRYHR